MLALASPPTLGDCAAVLAPEGGCHRMLWAVVRNQAACAPAYAFRDEAGRALVLCGFWPDPAYVEVWVALAPAAAPRMREIVAMARLTLAEQGQDDARPMVAVVRTRAGRRIAALLGFCDIGNGVFKRERT